MPTYFYPILLDSPLIINLKNFDRWLFQKINHDWTNAFLDQVFPIWREAMTWIPLYIFLFLVVVINFKPKIWIWIIAFITTVALTDQVSSHVVKTFIQRPRPCHDELLADHLRLLLQYCSNSFSFTSSHATNHFGIACFIYFTMRPFFGKWTYLFFVWAAAVSYGQVYIGIHYPLDVTGGALLGCGLGWLTAYIFKSRFGLPPLRHQTNPPGTI